MSDHFPIQSLLLFLLVYVYFTYSKEQYIRPSLDSPCHHNVTSCLTLSQFAANFSQSETDISLLFLQGNHTLDQKLFLTHGHNFSMTKYAQDDEKVFVECTSHLGRFHISEATFVSIKDLHFKGCGSNRVSQVTWLTIEDSFFQDVQDSNGKVLELNEVYSAKLERTCFLNNTLYGHKINNHDLDAVNYIYDHINKHRGVLYTAFSNVSIISSRFMHNRADIGGALVAHNSSLHINRSTYGYNTANFGGAMVTSASTIDIDNCIFTGNAAQHSGGVMVTLNDNFRIWNTNFAKSRANEHGGVMITFGKSSFTVSNSAFTSNNAYAGGVMATLDNSSFTISNSTFTSNYAYNDGGVMATWDNSLFCMSNSAFTSNYANFNGGVMATWNNSLFTIRNSAFTSNNAHDGGVIATRDNSSFAVSNSTFTLNYAYTGGVMVTLDNSSFTVSNSAFTSNNADRGGVMNTLGNSSFTIRNSAFTSNNAYSGGVIKTWDKSSFAVSNSAFTSNNAYTGGVMATLDNSLFTVSKCAFTSNYAYYGGVMETRVNSSFTIINSTFTSNYANFSGDVMETLDNSSFGVINCTFINHTATANNAVVRFRGSVLNFDNTNFHFNTVDHGGEIISLFQCSAHIANSVFEHNVGSSIYIFNSNLTLSGKSKYMYETSVEPLNAGSGSVSQGGVITSLQSTVIFKRDSITYLTSNQARDGGAILAIESTIILFGETIIANNSLTAIVNSSGGGISLKYSHLEIRGKCNIFNNSAARGGGIYATSSTISVYQPATLQIINNNAELGGGMYFEVNSKLYVLKKLPICPYWCYYSVNTYYVILTANHANYGGAMYVDDETNSGTCSLGNECFIQILALYSYQQYASESYSQNYITENILFSDNTATERGSNLFGGLLDRCIPSQFAEVYQNQKLHYSGVTYFQNISKSTTDIIPLDSIGSQPARVCFCNSKHEPDCNYQHPAITVKKGETFNVTVVAVDQVNNTLYANISTSISSSDGGFGEGQQTQNVGTNCTDLTYNVFSPHDSETINLFADGPCESAALSTSHVTIQFIDCTCPIGFQPRYKSKSSTRCECICDSKLSPYITDCNNATSSVFRLKTNSWITYINDTNPPGYVKYSYCPFDYCKPSVENVSINFNLPNGAEAQCAYNRTGILCGSCRGKLSLSLASSRCLPCHSCWPAVCVVIVLAAISAGILLVTALLVLNMTVSVGLINGFIFYANIVSAGSAIFFPSSKPSFPSVFVAWLNLDIGIDVCFIDGLDAYIKTWLELAFPAYIISLVVMVIIVSEYSDKFAGLIGKRDPISTLATLILISYAKLLSVTITALLFAKLDYPDGKQEIVWLPDGNVKYFQGKHIPLAVVALLVILIGLPFTIILFLWQWIVSAPNWKLFMWIRNTRLNAFITTYHVPHNSKYRYWTGLLLLARVVFYVTASITESGHPQTLPLLSALLSGGLILSKGLSGHRVYKNSLSDVLDTLLNFNLLALALFTLYDFKLNATKQTVVAYTSTIITFIAFIGAICYHVRLLKKKKPPVECNEPLLAPAPVEPTIAQVTHSVIELPRRDRDRPPDTDRDERDISEDCRLITPLYNDDY